MDIKKIFCAVIAAAIVSCEVPMPAVSAQTSDFAEAVFGTEVAVSGFARVENDSAALPQTSALGGQACLLMSPDENAHVNFTFENSFKAGIHDGSVYDFEVTYHDGGKGFIALEYDSEKLTAKSAGTIYTSGTDEWKTAVFSVDDGFFYKRIGGKYDFRLGVKISGIDETVSAAVMAVKSVRVTRRRDVNPIYVTAQTDESGNAFRWYDESKIISTKIENVSAQDRTAAVRFRLIDEGNRVYFDKTQTYDIKSGKSKNVDVDIGSVTDCGIYRYVVTAESGGIKSEFNPFNVAVLKTDPSGILNDEVMFAAHLEWYGDKTVQKNGVDMIKKSNSAGIRSNFDWNSMESDGTLDWNNHNMKNVTEELKKQGLRLLPIMSGPSLDYCSAWNEMPKTTKQLEGWRKYVRYSAEILKEYGVKEYEIWNEPNLASFNLNKDGGAVYAALLRASAEEIKAVDPTAKVGGPAVTGINGYWGRDYFTDAMDAGMGDYADAVTLHAYADDAAEKSDMPQSIEWFRNKFREYTGKTAEVWSSESGYSSADEGIDERAKGAFNSRATVYYKAAGLCDKVIFYNFEKKGVVKTDKEHQFGHVSPASAYGDKSGKSFVPEISYAMITGMNYVMARTAGGEIIDSDDKNVRICSFDSDKFGKKVLALYTLGDAKCVTLNLGAENVTYYDSLGNAEEICGKDGIFTFKATSEPMYIVGDIENPVFASENSMLSFDAGDIRASENGLIKIDLEKYTADNFEVEAELPQNAVLVQNRGFSGNNAELILKNCASVGETGRVTVRVTNGGKTVAVYDVNIKTAFEDAGTDTVQVDIIGNKTNEYKPTETMKADAVFGSTSDTDIQFTARYDLYRGGELLRSCSRDYSLAPYGVCTDSLIIAESGAGEYELKITVISETFSPIEKSIVLKRLAENENNVFTIKGHIPSGREGSAAALVVFGADGGYGIDGPYRGIFSDQCVTGINGEFSFKISVPQSDIRAYVISSDGNVTEFDFSPDKTERTTVYLVKELINAGGFSAEELMAGGISYIAEWKNTESAVDYDIYCALYKDKRLVSVKKINDTQDAARLSYKRYDADTAHKFDEIKVMIWKGGSMQNISDSYGTERGD